MTQEDPHGGGEAAASPSWTNVYAEERDLRTHAAVYTRLQGHQRMRSIFDPCVASENHNARWASKPLLLGIATATIQAFSVFNYFYNYVVYS